MGKYSDDPDMVRVKLSRATTLASSGWALGGRRREHMVPKPVTLPRLAFLEESDDSHAVDEDPRAGQVCSDVGQRRDP
jgi:hypothetical protein